MKGVAALRVERRPGLQMMKCGKGKRRADGAVANLCFPAGRRMDGRSRSCSPRGRTVLPGGRTMFPFTAAPRDARFRDRHDAGRRLAARLRAYAGRPNLLVLALPR